MFGPNAGTIQLPRAGRRPAHRVRFGGIRRKLLIGLVLLVALVAVLPIVIAKTHLRNLLVAMGLPNNAIRVTIGSASLSWTSNPLFQNVEVKDASGATLLVAESISIDRTPLKLAMNTHDLGRIQIVHPTLHVQVRPDGNTINDVLQKLRGSTAANVDQPASTDVTQAGSNVEAEHKSRTVDRRPVFAVELVGATVIADDVAANRQWRLQNVNMQYDGRAGGDRLGPASASGEIFASDRGMAPLSAGRFTASVKSNEAGLAEINLQADRIALAVAEPWLRQVQNGIELSGSLSGQATATCTLTTGKLPFDLASSGSLSIDQLNATTPGLKGDRVRLARIELPWRISAQPTGLTIQDLQLRSDVAELSVHGQIDPNAINHTNTTLIQFLSSRNDVEIRGAADLAKLAAMLPRSIHLRSDTTITSGTANISASLKPTSDGSQVHASVSAAQLAGTRGGKSIQWDQPINADIGVRQAKGTIADGSLKCDSKFLRVEAVGTLQQLTARANFDLNALTEQLGQFIDLSAVQLAGTGTAQLAWQQPNAGAFSATATGELSQLRVTLENKPICDEPQLSLQAQANGTADVRTYVPTRIEAAQLQINGQGDQLDARIAGSVDFTGAECVWPVAIHSTGSISRWLSRLRPWVSVDPWKIDGGSDFTANLRVAGAKFEATDTKLLVTDLRAIGPDWNINEPRIEFAGDARWNGTTGEFEANSAQLVSSTIALAAKGIHYGGNQPASQLAGAAAFRTDLGRLAGWRTQPNRSAQYQSTGQLTGNLRFTQVSGRVVGELAASGQNLSLATGNQTIWQEPQLTVRGSTTYDTTADRLSFDQCQIQSNTLQAAATGQVLKLSTVADCELNGTLNYDLAQVTPLLRPYVGGGVQLTGREQARFVLAGKLSDGTMPRAQLTAMTRDPYTTSTLNSGTSSVHWSRRIRAQVDLPWTAANVYGLPIGGGRIGATLGDGSLRIAPISLSVGDGQLAAAPSVQFDPQPAMLSLPAGRVLTNVRISREVSESMLKFVAPVLAGATQSDGLFSLQLDGARVPLTEPRLAESTGQFTVHSVRVVPGPTATPWVGLGQQIEALVKRRDPASLSGRQVTLVTIRDQQVNFRVKDGRVYHQNVEFQIGDITMRSQGSVGFDETIALTLEIPVQDAWIAKDPLLSGLKGQVLQVPVAGTLTKPKMDQHALTHLTSQLIQKGAGQAVGNELNKALDKFLKPR